MRLSQFKRNVVRNWKWMAGGAGVFLALLTIPGVERSTVQLVTAVREQVAKVLPED